MTIVFSCKDRSSASLGQSPRRGFKIACLGLATMLLAMPAVADIVSLHAIGVPQTGPNRGCGSPIWTFNGLPPQVETSGAFIAGPAAFGGGFLPISADQCANEPGILVVNYFDSFYAADRGWPTPDARLFSRFLRQVPYPAGDGIHAPIPVAGSVPPNPFPPTRLDPSPPITLGDWIGATGDLEIVCDTTEGVATIAARMQGLIPDGLYTVWGQWADPLPDVVIAPFGGIPNTIVADENGNAEFCRQVQFCPLDLAPDSSELQIVSVMYMANGMNFGIAPYQPNREDAFLGLDTLPFQSTLPGGAVSFDHLGFRINASGGPNPTGSPPAMCVGGAPTVASLSSSYSMGLGLLIAALCLAGLSALGRLRVRRR